MAAYGTTSWLRTGIALMLVALLSLAGCLGGSGSTTEAGDESGPVTIEVWHTFAAESKEENVFLQSVKAFEALHPNITVEVTMVPFGDADNLFMTAAQGGEAPASYTHLTLPTICSV